MNIRKYFTGSLELLAMLELDYSAYWPQDKQFTRMRLGPLADTIILSTISISGGMMRNHTSEPGTVPGNWHDVVIPLTDIAGLKYVLTRLPLRKCL